MMTKQVRGKGKETGQGASLSRRKKIRGHDVELAVCLNKVVAQKTERQTRIRSSECEYALLA